ncbi:hypothetical protein J1N35_029605 [Gossypium stocksii]|uniref:Reverse transcriptase domain-containing protein n=1 Tax=Gossypium stocksii TaxID=47602 RepID=A0A9D3UYD3_9ROSI|nr:hypothetical protein J1N35_029605 [Gossypium stocksii]
MSSLSWSFSTRKVLTTVKGIEPLKASGIDGFPALFFHKYWHIVGEEVTKFYLEILNRRKEINVINYTSIVLIPKVDSPNCMTQFRPISLCNVVYKIISKTIVNRFRVVLDKCIDEVQRKM